MPWELEGPRKPTPCRQRANLAKFKEVNLWVLHGNARGRRFYEREGFQTDSAPVKEAHVGSVKLPEVRYWKSVPILSAIITRPFAGVSERWQLSPIFTDKM